MSQYTKNTTKINNAVEKPSAQQRVYISGFKYTHNLTVGVAYYYRGHYIYAYPQRNPIEPIAFSTKKGIRILGLANDQAPEYNPEDPDLAYEGSVLALEKSCLHEQEARQEQIQRRGLEEMTGNTYTPHDRGQYLAYSAPGSRVGSVDSLQELSILAPQSGSLGIPGQSHSQDATVRTVASTSRLRYLIAEEEMSLIDKQSNDSSQQEVDAMTISLPSTEAWMDFASMNAFIEAVSRPTSQAPSRIHSPGVRDTASGHYDDVAHLPGPGQAHTAPVSTFSPSPTFFVPISTKSRPRAASRALNQAYNAANALSSATSLTPPPKVTTTSTVASISPCPLHGQPCDNDTVAEPSTSPRPNFAVQQVPMIRCADGRVIVDWMTLRDEEKKRF